MMKRNALALVAFVLGCAAGAQEVLSPLHVQPRGGQHRLKVGQNNWFIYQYDPQSLPLMDDFSIDRTKHPDAKPTDAGVTLNTTVYHLEVAGVSTDSMAFSTDTTWHYTVDTVGTDTVMRAANPNVVVTVYDISQYPSPSLTIDGWPRYNIWDTVGVVTVPDDTIWVAPDIVQDSLFVYNVPPDTRTYDMSGTLQPLILWEDDDAYINGNYPLDPPTIGVATLDGMDRTGLPYTTWPNLEGLADRLTSVPIDLSYDPSDSVYLSFYYQPQGLSGDIEVDPTDSLRLELYAPLEDQWYLQWYTSYTTLQPFKQVMLPVSDPRFLHDGFRMRFSNRATLNGALDQWHIDYVRLDQQRSFDDTVIVDVAFVYPETSLLEPYTAMPFDQFAQDPSAYMAPNVTETMRNLDVNDRFINYNYSAGVSGGPLDIIMLNDGTNTSGNASSSFGALLSVEDEPFLYDPALSDTCQLFYDVALWSHTSPDICAYNDTVHFTQELSNYFAYDDGSAEWGYSLNVNNAKLAYQFTMVGGDSLKSVRMYFDPIFSMDDPTDGNFLLTVWSSLNPEVIIRQNYTYSSPEYLPWGPDHFVDYPLDSAVWVEGTFYVGWTQTNAIRMNLGLDVNRDNADRIFYQSGTTSFFPTSQHGSLMMRPVFRSNCDPYAGITEPVMNGTATLYPNPANASFSIDTDDAAVIDLLDATGRQVRRWNAGEAPFDVRDLRNGFYLVRAFEGSGRATSTARLIVQH